jgi:hypothetical protein
MLDTTVKAWILDRQRQTFATDHFSCAENGLKIRF